MRLVVLVCAVLFVACSTPKGSIKKLRLLGADSVFVNNSNSNLYHLGGISGMEKTEDGFLWVSDRRLRSTEKKDQVSTLFTLSSDLKIQKAEPFFGIENAESIRIGENGTIYYSFETDSLTGVGYVNKDGVSKNIRTYPMYNYDLTAPNRGIEALSIKGDRLFYAFENPVNGWGTIINHPLTNKGRALNFKYPLDSKSCFGENQQLDENKGNGITEILNFPGKSNRILVLERCYNGRSNDIRIFETKIPKRNSTLKKKELFSWNLLDNHGVRPDNMEGMAWGKAINGKRVVYIVSDDNFNPKYQRTVVLRLGE